MVVAVTISLHNDIREDHTLDKDFVKCDKNPDYVPTISESYARYLSSQNTSDTLTTQSNHRAMDRFFG